MIKRLTDVQDQIEKIVKRTDQRGDVTGFQNLDKLYTVKQGSFTCFLGAPGHGKSEIIFEICINQSIKYGKRHLIYSPETGSVAEIMLELAHKYLMQPVYRTSYYDNSCDEKARATALDWVNHHFIIEDGDEDARSFAELSEDLLKEEKDSGMPIHTIMAEPYNEMKHDMVAFNGRQDLYIESFMSDVRRFTKKHNKHVFLSFHPGQQMMVTTPDKKFSYYPMPKAREAAGGQAALRKAMTWINIWRPSTKLLDEFGMPYQDNEVIVVIEKAKPKGVSFRGQTSLFFDFAKNRYYEEISRNRHYAFEHEKLNTKNHNNFIMPVSKDFDLVEVPFGGEDLLF